MKILLLFFLATFVAFSQTVEYHVDKSASNVVKFISDAPIENFEGVTSNIDGYLIHRSNDVTATSSLYFEVDLRTLDTGIGLRNRQMRDDYLHTDKFPMAKFTGRIVSASEAGVGHNVTVRGVMDIHGVKKPMEITGSLAPSGSRLRLRSSFEVKLGDHDIEIPRFMFLKIDETMKLELDYYLIKVKG